MTDANIATLVKHRQYRNPGDAITHIEYNQVVRGIEVFEAATRFHVTASGQLLSVSNSAAAVPEPISVAPVITASEAVVKGSESIGEAPPVPPKVKSQPQGAAQSTVYDRAHFASDITIKLVFFPWAGDFRLVWQMYLEPQGFPRGYLVN